MGMTFTWMLGSLLFIVLKWWNYFWVLVFEPSNPLYRYQDWDYNLTTELLIWTCWSVPLAFSIYMSVKQISDWIDAVTPAVVALEEVVAVEVVVEEVVTPSP